MSFEGLIKQGQSKKYEATDLEQQALLDLAKRDLSAAESMVNIDSDWSYNISYNAMLQSSRAFMFHNGYRPRGSGQHATVVQFMRQALGDKHREYIALFDQMRRKRNRLVYDTARLVASSESAKVLSVAREYVALISDLIKKE
jgi:uncharacterized protein (UPF0332 family)